MIILVGSSRVLCVLGLCSYGYVELGSEESSEEEEEEGKAGADEEEVRDY